MTLTTGWTQRGPLTRFAGAAGGDMLEVTDHGSAGWTARVRIGGNDWTPVGGSFHTRELAEAAAMLAGENLLNLQAVTA